MPYTSHLIFDASRVSELAEGSSRKLSAETDAAAIAEAERLLRSSRIVAGIKGDDPPEAGVISKDGQEFVCVIVNPPLSEESEAPLSLPSPSSALEADGAGPSDAGRQDGSWMPAGDRGQHGVET